MKRLFLFLLIFQFFNLEILYAQTFRLQRPVKDNIQTNGSYLYGEPNFQNPSLAHTGIDISIKYDTVFSAADGVVTFVGYNPQDTIGGYEPGGAGNYIITRTIWNGNFLYPMYFHLTKPLVSVNDSVKRGMPIAISGNTGNSTGPHLHFELRQNYSSYSASRNRRNPELWCAITGMGAIYGKVPNAPNSTRVDISPDPKPRPPYTTFSYALTYNFNDPAIGSDDIYQENYAIGDVKPGTYTITALNGSYRRVVTVKAGEVVNADAPTLVEDENTLVDNFELYQNFPNPFNSKTIISWRARVDGKVTLKIFDSMGREIETIIDDFTSAGEQSIQWDGSKLSSGIYICQLTIRNKIQRIKMTLIK